MLVHGGKGRVSTCGFVVLVGVQGRRKENLRLVIDDSLEQ